MVDTKILICIPSGERPRCNRFIDYFDQLSIPVGTVISKIHGQSPARNRNVGIKSAFEHKCTHILFIDDDVLVPSDGITRLLSHDKDIVSGLYLMRAYPHHPVLFSDQDEKGFCTWMQLSPEMTGLIEVASAGLGCCLIKMQVFKDLQEPWIRLGEVELDHWCDDLGFFNRAKKAGYKIWADLDLKCGHVGEVSIFPTVMNDKWFSTYETISGEGTASVPQVYLQPVVQTEDKNEKENLVTA